MTTAEKSARYRAKDIEGYRERKKEYAKIPEQKERRREYMRSWRESNRSRSNELARESYQRNKHKHVDKIKDRYYKKQYGISLEDKTHKVAAQEGKCLICKQEFSSSAGTHMDHCHKTQKLRGILCHVCNTKLAWFETYRQEIINYVDQTW